MMNNNLEQKLWAIGRSCPPSDRAPYAFEKRVMAVLAGRTAPDPLAVMARMLWRSVAPCLGLAIVLCVYAFRSPDAVNTAAETKTAPNLEEVLIEPFREEVALALAW